jgi:hypothetical protein
MNQVTFAPGNSPKDNPTSFWFWVGHLARNATDKLGLDQDHPVVVRVPKDVYVRDVTSGEMDVLKDRMSFEEHDNPIVEIIINGKVIVSESIPE